MPKLRTLLLVVLFSSAALLEASRLSSLSALTNGDSWWHLSSGLWILQNHGFPRHGLFSQASEQAWSASSWGYDVALAVAYKVVGLRSIPLFLMVFRVGLAVLTFLLAGGAGVRFWPAVGLSALAQYILGAVPPTPAYFSVLFFAVELLLLLDARRTGSGRWLWWLVPLFLVWANLDVQFVYGVTVLLLFLGAAGVEGLWASGVGTSVTQAAKFVGVSIAATACTPYFVESYASFLKTTFNAGNAYLPDFQALGFRQPQDYLLLLLAMAAFLVLGLRESRDGFQIVLLAGCLGLSFYARRDVWVVSLAALAVIGDGLAKESEPQRLKPRYLGDAYGTSGTRALPKTAQAASGTHGLPKTTYVAGGTRAIPATAVEMGELEEGDRPFESGPQRLKPQSLGDAYGTSGTRALSKTGQGSVGSGDLPETTQGSGGPLVPAKATYGAGGVDALPKTTDRSLFAISVAAGIAVGVVLVVFALRVPHGRDALLAKAGVSYPVGAADYIRDHRLPQPLFNAYEWGGFLTWYLPEYPVAIDSRSDLYGGDTIAEYSKVMNAAVPYTEYPALANAQTIVLPKKMNMAAALASVPRFQVAYSDDVSVVLTRSNVP